MTKLLRGHSSEVVELSAAEAAAPRLLASLSRDGNLRLWDVPAEACLSSLQLPDAGCMVRAVMRQDSDVLELVDWWRAASAAPTVCLTTPQHLARAAAVLLCPQAMAPDGRSLLVGTRKGQLVKYKIVPAAAAAAGAAAGADGQQTTAAEQPPERHQQTAAPPPAAQQQQQQAAVHIDEGSRRELALQGGASLSNSIDCVVSWAGGGLCVGGSILLSSMFHAGPSCFITHPIYYPACSAFCLAAGWPPSPAMAACASGTSAAAAARAARAARLLPWRRWQPGGCPTAAAAAAGPTAASLGRPGTGATSLW